MRSLESNSQKIDIALDKIKSALNKSDSGLARAVEVANNVGDVVASVRGSYDAIKPKVDKVLEVAEKTYAEAMQDHDRDGDVDFWDLLAWAGGSGAAVAGGVHLRNRGSNARKDRIEKELSDVRVALAAATGRIDRDPSPPTSPPATS